MIKELKYNGHTGQPSDYECRDGDLSVSLNFVPEDGALKSVLPPSKKYSTSGMNNAVHIHKTSRYIHHIWRRDDTAVGTSFNFVDADEYGVGGGKVTNIWSFSKDIQVYQVNSIGNTLLILASDGMHYFLWNEKEQRYQHLGTKIPELPISFGLQGEVKGSDKRGLNRNSLGVYPVTSSDLEWCAAQMNKFIADNATDAGKFVFPFFVRYAYRLYDGTLVNHSAPILMLCATNSNPTVIHTQTIDQRGSSFAAADLRIYGVVHNLDYAIASQIDLNALLLWKDIVTSVDIFISKPIYTYNQNALDETSDVIMGNSRNGDENSGVCVCKCKNSDVALNYQQHYFLSLYESVFGFGTNERSSGIIMNFVRPSKDVEDDIKNCAHFYFLKSIKIEDLKTDRTIISVPSDYLQSLVNREVMTDDYDSHETLVPKYSFIYNQRVNLANISKKLFIGFNGMAQYCYQDVPSQSGAYFVEARVAVKIDGREVVVGTAEHGYLSKLDLGSWLYFYYPNNNAYKLYLTFTAADLVTRTYYEIPLLKHDFLNGAYCFFRRIGYSKLPSVESIPDISPLQDWDVQIRNKLYTSDVGNPFSFPVLGINTIGASTIIGICSAAKALSEGQFGQFPLYAFTEEGVWALEVSATGSYSAKQPITRDVCIDAGSITQIDTAVLFATDRGIMLLSGSSSTCITDVIDSNEAFSFDSLPKLMNLLKSKVDNLADDAVSILPFNEFLKGCMMLYDYLHQRIIVFNPQRRYAYVYSLKSKMWGMMSSNLTSGLNSYPEALAMDKGYNLVDFSRSDVDKVSGLIVTRPFKMDDPDVFKTIDTIIQRGYFERGDVQQVLYGSNDLYHWLPVWSSADSYMRGFHGSPYKYFRIALLTEMDKSESLYGASISYAPRMQNQLR